MSRSSGKTKTKSQSKALVVPDLPELDTTEPVFELVVQSFKGKLPGEDDYDPEKDRLMIGFKFGNATVPAWLPKNTALEEVCPYDFLTAPSSGLRLGQTIKPHGSGFTNLKDGISTWTDLPPLAIWHAGHWLSDIIWKKNFDTRDLPSWIEKLVDKSLEDWPKQGIPPALYPFWVTSGEGTTGNNLYRVYELPEEEAKSVSNPRHPRHWPEKLQQSKASNYKGWGLGSPGYPGGATKATPTASTVTKAPSIPAGVRYRCDGCGHWYTQSDLVGHKMVCGQGESADWAMMCHNDCGCLTLDQASSPKPGFPRPKPEPKAEVVTSNDQEAEKEVAAT